MLLQIHFTLHSKYAFLCTNKLNAVKDVKRKYMFDKQIIYMYQEAILQLGVRPLDRSLDRSV